MFSIGYVHSADASEPLSIQGEIRKLLSKAKAPGILRLVFHDAGTFDMDDNLGIGLDSRDIKHGFKAACSPNRDLSVAHQQANHHN
ncbi:hypothetical protein ACLOJK_040327 [Asimina triloba]